MRKFTLTFFVFCVVIQITIAQESRISKSISQAKEQNKIFETIDSIFSPVTQRKQWFVDNFYNPETVSVLKYNGLNADSFGDAVSVAIPLNDSTIHLDLLAVQSSYYDYEVLTSEGKRIQSNKTVKHYRGVVKNIPNSIVAISFFENEIMGLISTSEGNFNISYDKNVGNHIFYNDKNIKSKPIFDCGVSLDADSTTYDPDILLSSNKSAATLLTNCVHLYFETEVDIFLNKGSVASVENYITGLFNQVATLYQNEGIYVEISEIFVWTTADPYTSSTTGGLLSQFQTNRTSFNGDLGHLLTFRNIGGGLAAGFSGLCNSNISERLAVSMIYDSYSNVPSYSWSVFVVTHEFGHLFGSRHTHACVWNGNNTAIDGCSSCMESPNPTLNTCNNCTIPPIPSGGGTIMSYCHQQSVGINFNIGFGTQPGNVIRNNVANASCLCACANTISSTITGPSAVCTNDTFTLNNAPAGATVTWQVIPTNLFTTSSGSGNTANLQLVNPNTTGASCVINYTITTGCGNVVIQKPFDAGIPITPTIVSVPSSVTVQPNTTVQLVVADYAPLYWEFVGNSSNYTYTLNPGDWQCNFTPTAAGSYTVKVRANYGCGFSDYDVVDVVCSRPDLTIQSLSASQSGSTVTISYSLKNIGLLDAISPVVKYYRSTNTTYDASDAYLGSSSFSTLAANGTIGVSNLSLPWTGTGNYILAYADPGNVIAELLETNNVQAKVVLEMQMMSANNTVVYPVPFENELNVNLVTTYPSGELHI